MDQTEKVGRSHCEIRGCAGPHSFGECGPSRTIADQAIVNVGIGWAGCTDRARTDWALAYPVEIIQAATRRGRVFALEIGLSDDMVQA